MKVVSWSNVHGQTCNTSNTIAIAVTVAMKQNRRCILTQTHFNLNNLESYMTGSRDESDNGIMDNGLDGLASVIKLRPIDKETVENYSIPILAKKLTLLPGTAGDNRKVFVDDMGKTASILIDEIDKHYDIVFIDVNSGSDELSKLIIDKADVVIVNLNQNRSVLDNYRRHQLKGKKVLYIIGSYDRDSSYNLNYLKHKYKFLTNDNTGIIPYSTEFMDAQSDGNVIRFFKRNIGTKGSNSYFIDSVNEAVNKLMKFASEKRSGSRR